MSCGINASELTQRITLQQRQSTQDTRGQQVHAWTDVCTVWAKAEPLRGREFFAAGQMQAEISTRFTVRWRAGVVAAMRVLWRGEPYDIDAVIDVKGARTVLEIMAHQGTKDGR